MILLFLLRIDTGKPCSNISWLNTALRKKRDLPNAKEWKIITSSSSANILNNTYNDNTSTTTITQPTPQQKNSNDCGVFMCYFAASVSNDVPITSFDQGYIDDNNGRQRIALS